MVNDELVESYLEKVLKLKERNPDMPDVILINAFKKSRPFEIAKYQIENPNCEFLAKYRAITSPDFLSTIDVWVKEFKDKPDYLDIIYI